MRFNHKNRPSLTGAIANLHRIFPMDSRRIQLTPICSVDLGKSVSQKIWAAVQIFLKTVCEIFRR